VSVNVNNPPVVSITAPVANSTAVGAVQVTATASSAAGVASVQFMLDGAALGSPVTAAPYQLSWDTTKTPNGTHSLTAVVTSKDNPAQTATSAAVSVNVNNPPVVSITAPTANATVVGTVQVTATASSAAGVASVQFMLDGAALGSAVTAAPYQLSWDTTKILNGSHSLTAVVTSKDNPAQTATSVAVSVKVNNPPVVSITAPVANATVVGATQVTATASSVAGVASVQFMLDGAVLGSAVTAAPYQLSCDTTKTPNGSHSLTAVVTSKDNPAQTATSVAVSVNVKNPPVVSITSPAPNSTVSMSAQVTATASSAAGVASVQFMLDGAVLGSPVTAAPYQLSWDTTKTANGSHSLTAVVKSNDNPAETATSAAVVVKVFNKALGPNLILNPSAETSTSGAPDNWTQDGSGTNTPTYTYLNTGHSGNHSLQVSIGSYTDGSADWAPDPVAVTPGGTYLFSDWYMSDSSSEIDTAVTLSDGTIQYSYIQTVLPASNWTQVVVEWDAPPNAVSVVFFHLIDSANSTLTTDDYSLQTYVPTPLTRGIVSVTIDDGYENAYTNALPILQQYNVTATFYIITAEQTNPDDVPNYMTDAQVLDLYAAGHELASHTVTHPDLTTVSASQLTTELQQSQATLASLIGCTPGAPPTSTCIPDLAYPDGAYNQTVATAAAQYYSLIRGIEPAFNTRDYTNFLDIKTQSVDNTTSVAQVEAWIQEAYVQKTWLVLIYHEVADTPTYPEDALYTTSIADFTSEMSYIHSLGIAAESVQQAASEIQPQL
jgi:peptidoglycan/xylan/chitin deacetylase (PgdA/CDA1 family)